MSRVRDEIDQLTARLTTPPPPPPPPDPEVVRPEIITLIIGHLPARAGLWRLPAARMLLPDAARLAVARLEEGTLVIETIDDAIAPAGSLSQDRNRLTGLPVIVVPSACEAPEAIADLEPDRVALLTGADQAAMVGAYRILKSLTVRPELEVELVIAGREIESAQEAADQLVEAARTHLSRTVRLIGAIPRITASTGLSRSHVSPAPPDGLLGVVRQIRCPKAAVEQSAGHNTCDPPEHRAVVSSFDSSVPLASGPLEELADTAETTGHDAAGSCARLAPAPPVEPVPVARSSIDSTSAPVEPELSEANLCDHLDGLTAIGMSCPGHAGVQLARDSFGSLQLVARVEDLAVVAIVQCWIERHRTLLERAVPGLHIDTHPPVHLLGNDLDALCSLRGFGYRPHLLVPETVRAVNGWRCVSLDHPSGCADSEVLADF